MKRAMAIQARIDPLKDAVYGGGEPTGEAHANMKAAMVAVRIDNMKVSPIMTNERAARTSAAR